MQLYINIIHTQTWEQKYDESNITGSMFLHPYWMRREYLLLDCSGQATAFIEML